MLPAHLDKNYSVLYPVYRELSGLLQPQASCAAQTPGARQPEAYDEHNKQFLPHPAFVRYFAMMRKVELAH